MHVPDEVNAGPGQAAAIIGAALRFPGASDPSGFHELTVTGRRMFRPTDTGEQFRVPDRDDKPVRGRSALAALLDDGSRGFGRDADLTGGITARHVLAAETVASALADIPPVGRAVAPGRIGVFIADMPEPGTVDVRAWVHQQLQMLTPGTLAAPRAHRRSSRVSHVPALRPVGSGIHEFFLSAIGTVRQGRGTALNGTANGTAVMNGSVPGGLHCSLRAVAEACEALNAGEFDLVLAGGVAVGAGGWPRSHAGAAWAGEHIRVYDLSPTGPLPGEGCGIVALTRAADARALEVPAYAEIAGWHYASHGGPQQTALPAAYRRADIDPADIQFVEGHGAATAAEDQAELSALLEVLGPRADRARNRCALGSVSANIGDTRAAAGVAALLKTAFAMTADVLPPSTGCVHPNRLLSGDAAPFRLPSAPELWPQTPVQLAAVNTLGTAPSPDAPRSGPAHLVLRRERDLSHRPGRRRKPSPLISATLPMDIPRQA
jgi:enediyne polyketide synthase